jgi:hypothetical protein
VKAAVVGDRGVAVRDVPQPAPAPNEVLIRVRASSLNRADLIVASGQPHGKLFGTGSRLGLECAGEVETVGSEVADLKAGDRVMASAPGGFAEYAVTDWGRVHRIPANNMTYEQATCFPVALQTMPLKEPPRPPDTFISPVTGRPAHPPMRKSALYLARRRYVASRRKSWASPSSRSVAYRLKLDGAVLGRSYRCHDAILVRKRVN